MVIGTLAATQGGSSDGLWQIDITAALHATMLQGLALHASSEHALALHASTLHG